MDAEALGGGEVEEGWGLVVSGVWMEVEREMGWYAYTAQWPSATSTSCRGSNSSPRRRRVGCNP